MAVVAGVGVGIGAAGAGGAIAGAAIAPIVLASTAATAVFGLACFKSLDVYDTSKCEEKSWLNFKCNVIRTMITSTCAGMCAAAVGGGAILLTPERVKAMKEFVRTQIPQEPPKYTAP